MSFLIPPAIAEAGENLADSVGSLMYTVAETAWDVVKTPGVVTGGLDLAGEILKIIQCGLKSQGNSENAAASAQQNAGAAGALPPDQQDFVNLLNFLTLLSDTATQQLINADPVLGSDIADFLKDINGGLKPITTLVCDLVDLSKVL